MGIAWEDGGYSSDVAIHLVINGSHYPVAQIGPDSLILRDPMEVPHGPAELIINVDGREETHHVILYAAAESSAAQSTELCYA